ncbi:hypothetical protein BD410DRAFT_836566 [Rickenella mellea]|uniref:BTB domain-containing protein n=1 Tax=Rickenella mellea TaxID=50990 RepID=A0A4Y7QHB1_9AGAM|nr:hypothetical protein BD410DRAFT_836566 [Rickenella mellea]
MDRDEVFPSSPFDGADADLILRSAEGAKFRVSKAILRETSPFFRDLLSLPQPPDSTPDGPAVEDGLPVIPVTESSATLDSLLRICYPIQSPAIFSLVTIENVLKAALKYDMEVAVSKMREALQASHFQSGYYAVEVFVVACDLKLEDDARAAARNTLKDPLFGPFDAYLERISAAVYHRLLKYHQRASAKASSTFADSSNARQELQSWTHQFFQCTSHSCSANEAVCCLEHGQVRISSWWLHYIKRVKAVVTVTPLRNDIFDVPFLVKSIFNSEHRVCDPCKQRLLSHWEQISGYLKDARDDAISKVEIDLSSAGFTKKKAGGIPPG